MTNLHTILNCKYLSIFENKFIYFGFTYNRLLVFILRIFQYGELNYDTWISTNIPNSFSTIDAKH